MTSTRLTEQQLAFFDTFGFVSFPGLLADRIDRVIEEFEAIWAANGGGHNGNGKSYTADFISGMAKTLPPMLQVMKDIGGVELPEALVKLTGDEPTTGSMVPEIKVVPELNS